jgi:hypothetical protein
MLPIRALRHDHVLVICDYIDMAIRRNDTFLARHLEELTMAQLAPNNDRNCLVERFFLTPAMHISSLTILPDGSVTFKHAGRTWHAPSTCAVHRIEPCYFCARLCHSYM